MTSDSEELSIFLFSTFKSQILIVYNIHILAAHPSTFLFPLV